MHCPPCCTSILSVRGSARCPQLLKAQDKCALRLPVVYHPYQPSSNMSYLQPYMGNPFPSLSSAEVLGSEEEGWGGGGGEEGGRKDDDNA